MFTFQASLGCYEWIEKYLLSEIRLDPRSSATTSGDLSRNEKTPPITNNGKVTRNIMHESLHSMGEYAITTTGVRSSYDGNLPAIKDVDLRIRHSILTMVVGPVGCGKYTLIKSLLGEMSSIAGEINITAPDTGCCAQEP